MATVEVIKTLTIPGAYIITKNNNSEPEPHVVVRASTTKFLGVLGDMAEYGFRHIPEKYYSNNIPKIEYLDKEDRKIIGTDLSVLEAIEKVMVPTISDDLTPPDPLLPNYFGTVMQDNNTVLLAIMPPGYTTMYVFDGPDVDLTGGIYMKANDNTTTSATDSGGSLSLSNSSSESGDGEVSGSGDLSSGTDEGVDPIAIEEGTESNEGSSSGTDSEPEQQSAQPSVNPDTPDIIDGWTNVAENVTKSAAIKITSGITLDDKNEVDYYRIIAFTIYPEGKGEVDINYVQLGYKTSENPYRNLSKYLLRKDFSGAISKYENNSGFLCDLANGSIVGSVDESLESSLLPKTETYSYTREYKRGDKVLFGKNDDVWTYTGDSPGVGYIPGFSVGKWTKSNTRGGRFTLQFNYDGTSYNFPCWINEYTVIVEDGNSLASFLADKGPFVISGSGLELNVIYNDVSIENINRSYYYLRKPDSSRMTPIEFFWNIRSAIKNNTLVITTN